ncbi:MAG TPA: transporter substrate-binding domain-containing protein [Burkholderiaceae bacterium]|nr:transporter substrate-binding domain-containing protein [Burkholderiaceae bacterium]
MNSPAAPLFHALHHVLHRALAGCLLAAGGALAAAPLTPGGGAAPIAVTIYGDDDYPPYSYLENGEMKGIYTAIIRAALKKMPDYQVELQPVPWKRGLVKLETGESFALYPPYLREAERPYMAYSEPIMAEQLVVYCNRPAIAQRTLKHWPADYYGLRIGYNAGFLSGGKAFDEAARAGRLSALPARSSRLNLLKLLKGRIDCYLNDRLSIEWELGKLRHEKLIEAGALEVRETAALSAEQGHLGYTMRDDGRFPYKQDFIRQFNAIIRDMKQDGEIRHTVERFLQGPG